MEASNVLIFLAALRSVTPQAYIPGVPLYSHNHRYGDKNQYICHCDHDKMCDKQNGQCSTTGGKCSKGWFGPSCQHLALDFKGGNTAWLTDQDIKTCNRQRGSSLTITLKVDQVVSWVRLEFKDTDLKHLDLKLNFKHVSGADQPCPSDQWKTDVLNRAEVFCPSSHKVRSVTLKGSDLRKLCNIYVARGKNVGLGTAAEASSVYVMPTEKFPPEAVGDGTVDTGVGTSHGCAHTNSQPKPPWIQVTLDPPEDVFSFKLYNRKEAQYRKRILGFKLIAKNAPGNKRFQHRDTTDPNTDNASLYILDVYPPGILKNTKTVRIELQEPYPYYQYNAGGVLTVCELLIFGGVCPTNKYGTNCNQNCGLCRDDQCNPFLGVCLNGCSEPGLIPPRCMDCREPGKTGRKCDQDCPSGTYGFGCAEKCPTCIKEKCAPNNGTCLEGCVSGYTGEKCEKPCPQGRYGLNCARECDTCKGPKCTSKEGKCDEGCIPGYFGEKCEHECPKGYYGLGCKFACESCADMDCNNVNGTCNIGCEGGRSGSFCTVCPPKFYGSNCSKPCGMCKGNITCENEVGTCDSGCVPGYLEPLCDEACPNRTYGDQCGQQCGMCAENTPCDHVNGTCTKGCREGYIEPFCDAESVKSGSKHAAIIIYILPLAILLALLAYLASRKRTPPQGIAPNAEVEAEEKSSVGDRNKNPTDKEIQKEQRPESSSDSSVVSSGERGSK